MVLTGPSATKILHPGTAMWNVLQVSAAIKDGIETVPDGEFQPPFEMNCVEKDMKTRLESKYKTRKLIIGRTG